jgi:protein SEY1
MMGGTYVAYNLNLLGPMLQMANAASNQALEIGKEKLRDFLENNETARQALAMPAKPRDSDAVSLDTLDSRGKKAERADDEDDF